MQLGERTSTKIRERYIAGIATPGTKINEMKVETAKSKAIPDYQSCGTKIKVSTSTMICGQFCYPNAIILPV